MPPFVLPKSIRLKRKPKRKTFLTSLADEVLLILLQNISISDILSLRLTCQHMVPACNDSLKARIHKLYIHPSSASLRRALNVCANPLFGPQIEEIVLLGRPMWSEIHAAYPGYRAIGTDAYRRGERFGDEDYSHAHEWESRFRAWPLVFPDFRTPIERLLSRSEYPAELTQRNGFQRFDASYAPLIDALARLPKLRRLGYAERSGHGAYYQMPEQKIESWAAMWAKTPEPPVRLRGRALMDVVAHLCDPEIRRSDANVLYALFSTSRLHFTSLSIATELPFIEDLKSELRSQIYCPKTMTGCSWRFPTTLELRFDCGWDFGHLHRVYNRLLQHSSPNLQELRLTLKPNARIKKPALDNTLEEVLGKQMFPNMRVLELELLAPPDHPHWTQKANKTATHRRPHRPTCQWFDIATFLRAHQQSLTTLSFKNVIFLYHDPLPAPRSTIAQTTRDILELLETTPGKLASFEWSFARYNHDARCQCVENGVAPICRKLWCGFYLWENAKNSDLVMLDDLTSELNIELNEEKSSWDFGGFVRRALRCREEVIGEGGVL